MFGNIRFNYRQSANIELLFKLLLAFQAKSLHQYEFLRLVLKDRVAKTYSCRWKRKAFFKFVQVFKDYPSSSSAAVAADTDTAAANYSSTQTALSAPSTPFVYTQRLKANILQYISTSSRTRSPTRCASSCYS